MRGCRAADCSARRVSCAGNGREQTRFAPRAVEFEFELRFNNSARSTMRPVRLPLAAGRMWAPLEFCGRPAAAALKRGGNETATKGPLPSRGRRAAPSSVSSGRLSGARPACMGCEGDLLRKSMREYKFARPRSGPGGHANGRAQRPLLAGRPAGRPRRLQFAHRRPIDSALGQIGAHGAPGLGSLRGAPLKRHLLRRANEPLAPIARPTN